MEVVLFFGPLLILFLGLSGKHSVAFLETTPLWNTWKNAQQVCQQDALFTNSTIAGDGQGNIEQSTPLSVCIGILWFFAIAFMFHAQHTTCDQYFVPAINVFIDKMRSSPYRWQQRWGNEAVAGATICALGCNGPELFSNLISLFTGSDAGIGVVVGSEIFNLLIIVGCSVIATPRTPLELEVSSFIRDIVFYGFSIGLLVWVLNDGIVQFHESVILLGAAVLYVSTVYFTVDIEQYVSPSKTEDCLDTKVHQDSATGRMHGILVTVDECYHSCMSDRVHHEERTHIQMEKSQSGITVEGFKFNRMPGGLPAGGALSEVGVPEDMLKYEDLKEVVVVSQGVIELHFRPKVLGPLEGHVTLRVKATNGIEDRDLLLKRIESHGQAWIHGYDASVLGGFSHCMHFLQDKEESLIMKIVTVQETLIETVLRLTLFWCDVKDISKEGMWPFCWLGAMCWLAIFSYGMLEVANEINYNIPEIPIAFLGITVCAVGTSFPNAVASIIMSSQDKPSAAIANALGSNVQNVFLAMALPWVIYSIDRMLKGKCMDIPMVVEGIQDGVFWMIGTLVLFIILVVMPVTCTLNKASGILLCSVYVLYLVYASGEAFYLFESPFEK